MERRDFLKNSALAGTGLAFSSYAGSPFALGAPSDKVVIVAVGTNGRGIQVAKMFSKLPNVEVAFICDVDANVIAKSQKEIESISGKKPKGEKDIRKLLEKKDIDAVLIATPDHWHAPAAIMSIVAGKHVYLEKPCSHNPREGEMLVEATRKYKKLVQMGTQRRSWDKVNMAISELRGGIIGNVYFAKAWYSNNRKSIGTGKASPVPTWLDYELWQGPAPRKPYQDNLIHYNWHWFWNWGTGEALNNGTHELDIARWGMDLNYPQKVVSAGGRYQFKDDWETPDTQTITLEFPERKAISWEGHSCNNYQTEGSSRGVIFYGENGTLVMPGGNSYKIYDFDNKLIKEATDENPIDGTNKFGMGDKLDGLHVSNFIDAIRNNASLNAEIEEGHKSTLLCQLGNIAYRTGKTLLCDPANGRIKNEPDAIKYWGREYEKGWEPKY